MAATPFRLNQNTTLKLMRNPPTGQPPLWAARVTLIKGTGVRVTDGNEELALAEGTVLHVAGRTDVGVLSGADEAIGFYEIIDLHPVK